MKKILIAIVTLLVTAASTYGQDVTTFLGIPIDGSKEEMICKLEEKGFVREGEYLLGRFYGRDAIVVPQSTNGLLAAIYVLYLRLGRDEAKTLYNTLFRGFSNSDKYIFDNGDGLLDDNADLRTLVSKENSFVSFFLQKGKSDIDTYDQLIMLDVSVDLTQQGSYSIGIVYNNLKNQQEDDL